MSHLAIVRSQDYQNYEGRTVIERADKRHAQRPCVLTPIKCGLACPRLGYSGRSLSIAGNKPCVQFATALVFIFLAGILKIFLSLAALVLRLSPCSIGGVFERQYGQNARYMEALCCVGEWSAGGRKKKKKKKRKKKKKKNERTTFNAERSTSNITGTPAGCPVSAIGYRVPGAHAAFAWACLGRSSLSPIRRQICSPVWSEAQGGDLDER